MASSSGTHSHLQHSNNHEEKMEFLEQENQVLREEVAAMRIKMDEMTELMKMLSAAQNQPPPPPPPISTQAEATVSIVPQWTIPISTSPNSMPEGRPWGVPICLSEVFRPIACEAQMPTHQYAAHVPPLPLRAPPVVMTYSAPVMHTIPQNEEPIFHSGNMEPDDRVNDLREKYDEMHREMRALRGKEKFGKTEHLKMYVRRMYAYARDDQVLIFYFQESLAGPASKWYTNLDKTKIQTFHDLCEAFVQQYDYNVDMAPDRSDLQAMTQGDKETFKEYAQRWRDTAAQVSPRIEEKEMTKLFLKTLDQFYYEKMVGSTPKNFAEMVGMGVQLEEGVREGRLVRAGTLASAVAHGSSQPKYQHIAVVTPATNVIQQPGYSGKQGVTGYQSQSQQQPRQQAPRTRFDPIPMKYAELLPSLLKGNYVQTKPPPPMPGKLPAGFRADLSCDFHQGAPGHDVERCYV
ncbi:uncharacterized protein [Medicago truncatula]|uniref:uncharacterized protein n=1 Tax=Medicago truncatula TaxID=3880 RepID=UPI0019677F44|nr:uncharacterized protein LOC120576048 [Medicago truncatula]